MSTEARVPGVSEASIASNVRAAVFMSSSVAKCCRTIAVPCASSCSIVKAVAGTPGGGPSDSLIRAIVAFTRSAFTLVNLTTRTYDMGYLLPFALGANIHPCSARQERCGVLVEAFRLSRHELDDRDRPMCL